MARSIAALSILYFAIVYFLGYLLQKLKIIKKPLLKKGFLSSATFFMGIVFTVFGLHLYETSQGVAIFFLTLGIVLGIIKTSSDGFQTEGSRVRSETKEQESAEKTEDNKTQDNTSEPIDDLLGEQVSLNVVDGKRSTFVYPYMLLLIFFSLCLVFSIIALFMTVLGSLFSEANLHDVGAFLKLIVKLDFNGIKQQNPTGPQTDALALAIAITSGVVLLLLTVVFGALLKVFKRKRVSQRVVTALLPGQKRGFVPCTEGIYKLCYMNIVTKNRFYVLFPWNSLYLCLVDEKRKRIVLRAGKLLMPLIPWSKKGGMFNNLKSVVLGHLLNENKIIPIKKRGYRWGRVLVVVLAFFVLWVILAGLLESASDEGAGSEQCDVGGSFHFSFKPAFADTGNKIQIFDENNRIMYSYCELHGILYEILHPQVYIRTIRRLITDNEFAKILEDPIAFFDLIIAPAIVWVYLLFIVLGAGKLPKFRFNVL